MESKYTQAQLTQFFKYVEVNKLYFKTQEDMRLALDAYYKRMYRQYY